MNHPVRKIAKPQRWDQPFDERMSGAPVDELLAVEPFASMDESTFDPGLPLRGILQNDCRLIHFESGDILMRQGEYGGSVFLVLEGELDACLSPLPDEVLGRSAHPKRTFWQHVARIFRRPGGNERRELHRQQFINQRDDSANIRLFVQDVPALLSGKKTEPVHAGQMFGEVSALTRSPRTSTVFGKGRGTCLEMRWQGFRDLLRKSPALKAHVDKAYRQYSLNAHLGETDLLRHLPESKIQEIASRTQLLSFGKMQWTSEYRSTAKADIAERILREPLIAAQGEYLSGLMLIRSGFARVTRRHGIGEQTIEYLGRGRHFGLRELMHNARHRTTLPWQLSLRAVGYVDVLHIPVDVVEQEIIPAIPRELHPPPIQIERPRSDVQSRRQQTRKPTLETSLLEMLVEKRLVNGTQAMVIDLNRCTRCDDCIRACADEHDGNPRFVRDGVIHDHWMFANACMQCEDPVCMIGCPTGAIGRESASGVVTINEQTCVGCQTCANSCPYNNIQMVAISDSGGTPMVAEDSGLPVLQATKCDLCLGSSLGPACERACPHDALVRIDLTSNDALTVWIKG